ncbi:TetR/AcrR family transcriptional regulator [Tsukamurella sp. 8F]|uniref:TetR/AcrR family transcriptional regulator n=1 Tax=unclassified Tsukamurella TaxID=2633480 RepID=UPI0023B91CF9|nr:MULTISPECIES: TetR/AcrR family transcriptional regulator [unclassified Tsukamurella]MDF0531227.1 TetR/AcrR family transcriptional regulator [Tsukamurella sp. 8J]MDF0588496.1 TetR/AcrR family transcriptional regulator [Tsukamurella sp. 8F]
MQSRAAYHHGDLPAALIRAAIEMLDADGADADLSLRAVARRAGVSTGAPYRHFSDRNALLSAVAAVGYRELAVTLQQANPDPESADDIADIAISYVQFALTRPGLFRVMFGGVCDTENADRVAAVAAINAYLLNIVETSVATDTPEALATGAWALVHGLAFLFIDGKLDPSSPDQVASTVRATVVATLGLNH